MDQPAEEKPRRLYYKSYLKLIENSVGSNLFRNFYVKTSKKGEFDAFDDGYNSCAFYVSSILYLCKKLSDFHGTVVNTVEDLKKSGWRKVSEPKPGDVLVWEPQQFPAGMVSHIGFYIGDGRVISTSIKTKTPVRHEQNFGRQQRKITEIWRVNWHDS